MSDFVEFPKMARLKRECIITEKIDGTNACVKITEDGQFLTGSRTRWITPSNDNYGFSKWAHEHKEELLGLGVGTHFGEWWGSGCQRGYGLTNGEKRWSLFNVVRWSFEVLPKCCNVVPLLYRGVFHTAHVDDCLRWLEREGSQAAPGFMKPEGVVCFHVAGNVGFKTTIEKDDEYKGKAS
jgi:hypothetical protein